MEWKDLKDKISTPGDVAAALISGTAGFAVDVFLFPAGVPPGTTALVFAGGGLGLKKGFEAWRNERKASLEAKQKQKAAEDNRKNLPHRLEKQADALGKVLAGGNTPSLAEQLQRSRLLWESQIQSDDEFASTLASISNEFVQGEKLRKSH